MAIKHRVKRLEAARQQQPEELYICVLRGKQPPPQSPSDNSIIIHALDGEPTRQAIARNGIDLDTRPERLVVVVDRGAHVVEGG